MNLEDARKLHNGDQVTWLETGEIVEVISAYPSEYPDYHCIEVMTSDGFKVLSHLEIG